MMDRRFDFMVALCISAVLNVCAGIVIGVILDWAARHDAVPAFGEGEASVFVTLEAPRAQEQSPVASPPLPLARLPPKSISAEHAPHAATPEPSVPRPIPPAAPAAPLPAPMSLSTSPESLPVSANTVPKLPESSAFLPPTRDAAVIALVPAQSSVPGGEDARDEDIRGPEFFDVDLQPVYPMAARQHGEEGTVRILVELDRDGRARNITVEKSSGFASLDKAAQSAIRKARFKAKSMSIPDGTRVRLSIRFALKDEGRRS